MAQLACQQPDESTIFRALEDKSGLLTWRNKPQTADPCIATLAHSGFVNSVAASETLLVCGAGKFLHVYNVRTHESLLEFEGESKVKSVSVCDGFLAAGFESGMLAVWDAGTSNVRFVCIEPCTV